MKTCEVFKTLQISVVEKGLAGCAVLQKLTKLCGVLFIFGCMIFISGMGRKRMLGLGLDNGRPRVGEVPPSTPTCAAGFVDMRGMRDDTGTELGDRSDFNMIETSLALSTDWRNHYAGYYPKVTDVYPYGVNAFSQPVYTFTVFR